MREAATSEAPGFRLGLGHPVLEFVATLAGRRSQPLERLATPDDLERWLAASGIADGACCDEKLLAEARKLRETSYQILAAARARRHPADDDLRLLNDWAGKPTPSLRLDANLHAHVTGPDLCPAALAQLARATIELVAGPELQRVRNCANSTCSLMFIDHSRPGRRRWCSMNRCGNQAKTARYRQHRRQQTR